MTTADEICATGATPALTAPARAGRRPLRLRPVAAFAGTSLAFVAVALAVGAPSPLFVLYEQEWGFAPWLLTVAFAIYAVTLLITLLVAGSLSDHIGRRPVLIGALIIQIASNLTFLAASGVGWVIAGRIIQGVASGAATAAFTAALVELAAPNRKRLGTVLGSVGLTGGLGFGSLLAGLAIQLTPAANSIIFVVLTVVTIFGTVLVVLSPETATRVPGALRSLVPRIAFPPATRREFAAAAPVVAAVWMLAGLSGGLAPSMVRSVFHLNSGLLNGLAGFVAPATSAVVGLAFARVDSRRAMTWGIYASIVGAIGIITGVLAGSLAVMIIGQAIAGVGFGAAFTAALQLIFPLAGPHQRAGVVAGIYLVSYLALGIPVVIAGQLSGPIGEVPAVTSYTALTVVLALASLIAQLRLKRRTHV